MTGSFKAYAHAMTRVTVFTGIDFDRFLSAFEAAAPAFDPIPVQRIIESGGTWGDVRAKVSENAPNELMVYAKIDATSLFRVAGHDIKAVEFLLGNHVIAETMFGHEPKALLYAPLRVLVYSDCDDNAVFTMDRPSSAFGSLGIDEVTKVGLSLDQKVANLLRVTGVDPMQAFEN